MAGVRLVTDSASDLPQDVVDAHGIVIVPLNIRFGDEELVDREDISAAEFYARMATFDGLPETSAPSPGSFEEAFRKAAADGADAVVCVTISSDLSATMASAQNAARALEGKLDVRVVDSKSITSGQGTLVTLAAEAAAGGAGADEVVALVERTRPRTRVLGGLDTLENLKKGGRIGGAQAMLGTLLSIKPLIDISSGAVEEAGKVRTRKKQMLFIRDRLVEAGDVEQLVICDGQAPDAEEFVDLIAEVAGRGNYTRSTIGPVIGTHGGPRMIGLTWLDPA
ncbi:MAG TPA: DegV family protein [Acidimicrobiales bacterium]|nr:DegV family protein [Acidimicrobiales bacterium]